MPQISPDGSAVLYATNGALYVRRLDSFNATMVPGSEMYTNASFWSADSGSVFYPASGAGGLIRVRVPDGAPEVVMPAPGAHPRRKLEWQRSDSGLHDHSAISARMSPGSKTQTLDVPGLTNGRIWYPEFLPGGDALLFLWQPYDGTGNVIYLASFKAGKVVDPSRC